MRVNNGDSQGWADTDCVRPHLKSVNSRASRFIAAEGCFMHRARMYMLLLHVYLLDFGQFSFFSVVFNIMENLGVGKCCHDPSIPMRAHKVPFDLRPGPARAETSTYR